MISCKSFSFTVAGRPEDLADARRRIQSYLVSSARSPQQSDDLVMAASELLALVLSAREGRSVEISIHCADLDLSTRLTVSWSGTPLPLPPSDSSPFAKPEATHRFLSESYVDRWSYRQDQYRHQVVLEKYHAQDMCGRL